MLGKMLEKVYINSTDIEYAQFYNQNLSVKIDKIISDANLKINQAELKKHVEEEFEILEKRKSDYFALFYKHQR